jgi:hypothetical protein
MVNSRVAKEPIGPCVLLRNNSVLASVCFSTKPKTKKKECGIPQLERGSNPTQAPLYPSRRNGTEKRKWEVRNK